MTTAPAVYPRPKSNVKRAAAARSCLLVEDEPRLRATLGELLCERGLRVDACGSVAAAREHLERSDFDLLVLDFELEDGTGLELLSSLRTSERWPSVVAISGRVQPEQAFALAAGGARAFVQKPIDPAELEAAIDGALSSAPDLVAHLRSAVGHLPIHQAEDLTRRTMVTEALHRAHGSRRSAARMLSVSRQLLQHMIRRLELASADS